MAQGPVLSVVDYAAWEKGYMPPSEHILIDKLSYRGAKVVMSFSVASKEQVWIVFEGVELTSPKRRLLIEIMRKWFDTDEQSEQPNEDASRSAEAPAAENETTEQREVLSAP